MQSPSFLSHQRSLEKSRARSSCRTLFAVEKIPTDNHIRKMLDPVEPDALFGLFGQTLDLLEERGGLKDFRRLGGRVLIAFDGTEYFTSKKLHCATTVPLIIEQIQLVGHTAPLHCVIAFRK